jgi:allantoinase
MSGVEKFAICSKNVLLEGKLQPALIQIENGKITELADYGRKTSIDSVEDFGEACVIPGLVDSHVHVNEPGRTSWEGFATATQAALAGGITTIADMPLNSDPVTTSLDALLTKIEACTGQLYTDTMLFGGVVPGNVDQLELMIDRGVAGFKCFLIHSGIDDFPNVSEVDLDKAMPVLANHGIPLLVHAELAMDDVDPEFQDINNLLQNCPETAYRHHLLSRPKSMENKAIDMMLRLSTKYKCPVHIVHLSSTDLLLDIASIKKNLPFSVETCPHYLFLEAEKVKDGDTRFKCTPPIREKENKEKLWDGLKSGIIDFVVSDHSPCTLDLKCMDKGDFAKAWGGISSLQFGLPVVWTEANKREIGLEEVVEWMSTKTAKFLGLSEQKGCLEEGFDADLVVFDPFEKFTVEKELIKYKNKFSPYEGEELQGVVKATYLHGRKVFERNGNKLGEIIGSPGGRILQRTSLGAKTK